MFHGVNNLCNLNVHNKKKKMFLSPLITIPLAGMIAIFLFNSPNSETHETDNKSYAFAKTIALFTSLTNLIISLMV